MVLGEPIEITYKVAAVFEQLGIRYLIGGSLASSLHGIPRATQDVDLVAEILPSKVASFVKALGDEFYVDQDMVTDAIRRESSFNIIHLNTMFKVDIFILSKSAHAQEEMNRRESYKLSDDDMELYVSSAEDIILEKLRWYELGERISDRQWNDVLGVIKVKKGQLDENYLRKKAHQMRLTGLLDKAMQDSDI